MPDHPRRRILCIRPARDANLPSDPAGAADWTEPAAARADVTVHEENGDLAALCAEHRPDLIVLEGASRVRPWPPAIGNPRACPLIPRVMLVTGEPHDPLRGMAMRTADALGIETMFLPGEAHRQHMPELAHRWCHFAPLAFDPATYRDRKLEKVLPVAVLDSNIEPDLHPWRASLLREVRPVLPTLAFPREAVAAAAPAFPLPREARACLMNQSWFCAADTGRLDTVVADHLHIPASGAVLVAPPSPALAAYGFVDMANCVLDAGPDLVRKLDYLSRLPAEYERVRAAGMALAARFAGRTAKVLLDWFECRSRLKPGQVVQQVDRYGPFRGVTPTYATPSVLASQVPDSPMARALRTTQAAILSGDSLRAALPAIDEATRWSTNVSEPLFLFSLFALLSGKVLEATMGFGSRAERLGSQDARLAAFDPVETAWLLLASRLLDHAPLEAAMREQAAAVSHLSLRRMMWLLDGHESDLVVGEDLLARRDDDLPSVHWVGGEDFTQWADLVRRVLVANRASPGQPAVARRLLAAA